MRVPKKIINRISAPPQKKHKNKKHILPRQFQYTDDRLLRGGKSRSTQTMLLWQKKRRPWLQTALNDPLMIVFSLSAFKQRTHAWDREFLLTKKPELPPFSDKVEGSFMQALKARLLYEEVTLQADPRFIDPYRTIKYVVLPQAYGSAKYPVAEVKGRITKDYIDLFISSAWAILVKKSEDDVPGETVRAGALPIARS